MEDNSDSSSSVAQGSVKLAGDREGRPLRLLDDHEDSGIDSDNNNDRVNHAVQGAGEKVFDSSSDEEVLDTEKPAWFINTESGKVDAVKMAPAKSQYTFENFDVKEPDLEDSDRASPLLYEVELTASDEDDEGSVLELVIPMHSKYQRVPTSSDPEKDPCCFFARVMCCMKL